MFNLSETVRQMLGLEEDQVVELSGDNAKYEVINLEGFKVIMKACSPCEERENVHRVVHMFGLVPY